jgi:DNA-binding transcriptional MerR regulator
MFTIGEFATVGQVTVRMLRHYDAIGLLPPAAVDPVTGYRRYTADQLRRLNRLVALRELGFTLEQIGPLLDEKLDAEALRGMYRLRQAELTARIDADRARLARVEARLRIIESESTMSRPPEVSVRPLPAVTVVQVRGTADGVGDVGPVISDLYGRLGRACAAHGVVSTGPAVARYRPADDGDGVVCLAGLPVAAGTTAPDGVEVTTLPPVDAAAVALHVGAPDGFDAVYQRLAVWIEDNGYRTDGTARETYLVSVPEPAEAWRTEIALPLTNA